MCGTYLTIIIYPTMSNLHIYNLYYAHYDGEGVLTTPMVQGVLDTFCFREEPSNNKLQEAVGKSLLKHYNTPDVQRLITAMFYYHEDYTGWTKNVKLIPILNKIFTTESCWTSTATPEHPNSASLKYDKMAELLTPSEMYTLFMEMINAMSCASLVVSKVSFSHTKKLINLIC